jgi:3-deoxy-manno-octulosonate cytidylyltransferase (CMP-KDO synthetase)
MKFIGIIPAHYNSTRLPGKPLALIGGKPMVLRTYEQVAKAMDEVWVAYDDRRIGEAVWDFGGIGVETSHAICGTDRCAEAISKLPDLHNIAVVNIQCDEPLIDPAVITKLMHYFVRTKAEIATIACRSTPQDLAKPGAVRVIIKDGVADFSRMNIADQHNLQHIGIYIYRAETLIYLSKLIPTVNERALRLEQMRWIDNGHRIHCMIIPECKSVSVNTPEDLIKANEKWKEIKLKNLSVPKPKRS